MHYLEIKFQKKLEEGQARPLPTGEGKPSSEPLPLLSPVSKILHTPLVAWVKTV